MNTTIPTPMFILEMANNHMGDLSHGLRIVREFKEVTRDFSQFQFSIKLQHRDETFFHPDYRERMDYKYIKRFTETKLSKDDFRRLKDGIQEAGFISMCTPWDEPSVDLMEELGFDIIKIASCSFTDWPLLERAVKSKKPIIASTAAATADEIDRVVSFFSHRQKNFAIMHCVGEYPCLREHLELNQVDYFQKRYPGVPVGFSTHEEPANLDSIRIAIGKGALLFEKHVAVPTQAYAANAYSASPAQARKWLEAAADAAAMCGVKAERREIYAKEIADIEPLLRGVFAVRDIKKGQKITEKDYFLAMPNTSGQLLAKHLSKYTEFHAQDDVPKNAGLMLKDLASRDLREKVRQIVDDLRSLLKQRRIALPPYVHLEISHHYGLERFHEVGAVLIHIINRAYSKMLVVMFPGQSYPRHHHIQKDESYHLLHGDLTVEIDGEISHLKEGDVLSIGHGMPHSFKTVSGAIIEEVATTYVKGDSIYDDSAINDNSNRKIYLTFWPEWLAA
jgi:sialic acid synthase SpsE/mannose-6-phosphate isomerase-like protein (cupin superfamily)